MFTQIRVKNFKAWQGEHRVELAPLNLFLGTNSAGKTSLLQMLLLLKQTVASPDRHQHLNLGGQSGDLLHLGGFSDIVSGHDVRRELAFGLHFTGVSPEKGQKPVEFDYDASFCQAQGDVPELKSLKYATAGQIFTAELREKGAYFLTGAGSTDSEPIGQSSPLIGKRYAPERSIAFPAAAVAALGLDGAKVQDLALQMDEVLRGIVYLGPLRERPQRFYPWNRQRPGDLGSKGEFAIQALLASAKEQFAPPSSERPSARPANLVMQVSYWLQEMGVADGLTLEQQGSSVHHEVIVRQGKIKVNLIDVGFGVSQVLPVVTLAYFVPEGSTVLLEQPEIHLHPLAQTALADLFMHVSQTRRVQFLVETHSEHLLRRLQSLIADEQISPEDCRLYFVKRGEDSAALDRLVVDEYGRINNWPEKFFGDAIGEVERQTRRMIERKAKQQGS